MSKRASAAYVYKRPEVDGRCCSNIILHRSDHTELESTALYLGIEVEDALEIAEKTDVLLHDT